MQILSQLVVAGDRGETFTSSGGGDCSVFHSMSSCYRKHDGCYILPTQFLSQPFMAGVRVEIMTSGGSHKRLTKYCQPVASMT